MKMKVVEGVRYVGEMMAELGNRGNSVADLLQ